MTRLIKYNKVPWKRYGVLTLSRNEVSSHAVYRVFRPHVALSHYFAPLLRKPCGLRSATSSRHSHAWDVMYAYACVHRACARSRNGSARFLSLRSMTWFQLNRPPVAPLSTSTNGAPTVLSLFFPIESQTKFKHLRDHDSIQSAHSSRLSHATKRTERAREIDFLFIPEIGRKIAIN